MPGVAELLRPAVPLPATSDERQATGRERHDQKITVYLSAIELLDLEHARLTLRRFGFVVDRGRLVREAIAILLADLDARGKDSVIARRIRADRDADQNASQDNDEDAVPSLMWARLLVAPGQAISPLVRRVTRHGARAPSRCTSTSSRGRSTCFSG
jgi:hypothetical protein